MSRLIHRLISSWIRCFPRSFRDRFGDSIRRDLEDQWAALRSPWARCKFVVVTGADLMSSAVRERWSGARKDEIPAGGGGMEPWIHDARIAFRGLRRRPGYSALAIGTLALGLGATAAVYALVDGVLLRPLPYPDPDRLVRVWSAQLDGDQRFMEASWPEVQRLREVSVFQAVAAFSVAPRDLVDSVGRPMGIQLARISEGYLEVIGVEPMIGRGISEREYSDGAPVVLLAHGFWQSRYGSQASILGERVSIQGVDHEIVGVMPAAFDLPYGVSLWRPFTREENQDGDRELVVLARLKDGIDYPQADAQLAVALGGGDVADGMTAWVQSLQDMLARRVDGPLWVVMAAVAALLLLACSNVAHLQLARSASRRREMAVRSALGADRVAMGRLVAVESLTLAVCGGVLGLWVGHLLLQLFRRLAPPDLPRLVEAGIDLRVVLVMAATTGLAGALASWLPARLGSRVDPAGDLRTSVGTVSGARSNRVLVIAEVTVATLLAATAGLMLSSMSQRLDVDHGLRVDGAMLMTVSPPAAADDAESRRRFYEDLAANVAGAPGIESAGIGNHHPLDAGGFRMPLLSLEGVAAEPDDLRVVIRSVDGGWMTATGLRLLAGRLFDPSLDSADGPGTVIVDETFVRTVMGVAARDALGLKLTHPGYFSSDDTTVRRIVGVVASVRADATEHRAPRLYLPYAQFPWPRMQLLMRTERDPALAVAAVRSRIWSQDPTIPLGEGQTLQAWIDQRLEHHRFQTRLIGAFAQLALILAAVGLYAVLSMSIAHQIRELGLRRALGAGHGSIVGGVVQQALYLVTPGLALGLAGATWVGHLLSKHVYGIQAVEPGLWLWVSLTLLAISACAVALPLKRALDVSPAVALRGD